jgi:hypothetical protein
MICFDTQILIWGVQGTSHPDQASMIERTRHYIAPLEQAKEQVMIPAPVLAEHLVGFEPADHERRRIYEI